MSDEEIWPPSTKILVVDDFQVMRTKIEHYLEEMGMTNITTAESGQTAIEKFDQAKASGEPFALILSDWNMPDVTGIEFLRHVRGDSEVGDTAFIMITGETGSNHIVEAAKIGVTDYLGKPFNQDRLRTKLTKAYKRFKERNS